MASNLLIAAASLPLCTLCALLIISAAAAADREYDYSSGGPRGPEHWATLHRSWTLCSSGSLQSPINLTEETVTRDRSLHKLESKYNASASASKFSWRSDIVLDYQDPTGILLINDTKYTLFQVRVHTPGEHTLKGKTYPAEVHLIHNSTDGRTAIVSFSFKIGRPNVFLAQVIDLLNNNGSELDATVLKMTGRAYYRYSGSLTSPPCTEGVDWYVVKKNRRMSVDQFQFIHNYVNGSNARPIQPVNGRVIEAYK